jgi:rare lipoprotein A
MQPQVNSPKPGAGGPEKQAAASRRDKETRTGLASFIAARFQGRKTASGELYDGAQLVAAHPSYPMGTVVRVTNQENGRVVQVKVTDRSAAGRDRPIIDLSRAAAERLEFVRQGTVKVTTEVVEWGAEQPGK